MPANASWSPKAYADWVMDPSLPAHPVLPSSSYLICATPRTGSWLLCGLLASTGVAGRPHEWFVEEAQKRFARAWGAREFGHYLQLVREAGTTPNGVFGLKVMWGYHERLLEQLRALGSARSDAELIEAWFSRARFIWLHRENVHAQALSWAKAIRTDVWVRWQAPGDNRSALRDRLRARGLVRTIRAHDAAWRGWFADNGIEPHVVRYEDLVADPGRVASGVLAFLGLDAQVEWT
jgi:LPS sulfotransferase NodH